MGGDFPTCSVNILRLVVLLLCSTNCFGDVEKIKEFLDNYNEEANELQHKDTLAAWNYEADMSIKNKRKTTEMSAKASKFALKSRKQAEELITNIDGNEDVPNELMRQLKLITRTASSSSSDDTKKMTNLVSRMTALYSKTTIKKTVGNVEHDFTLNTHLLPIMSVIEKDNLNNIRWAWKVWRKAVGPKIKPLYEEFVKLANEAASENGYKDYGDYWKQEYEVDDLESSMEKNLNEMLGLYKKLHAYTRYKLNNLTGDDIVKKDGPMPAHLLSMWGQNWGHLYKHLQPFPNKTIPDVTEELKKSGYDTVGLLKLAESFFVSIGLEPMPKIFFKNSLIKQVKNKKSVCHPSSWDLGKGDVRLKMPCMGVSQGDMVTVHHEMGHLEYYLLYKDLSIEFRTGANPGFHEAVGDTIALSVMIPEHLKSIGLLKESTGDKEEEINFLMKQALQKVAFIPFAFIVDKWRWSVFRGDTKPDEYNTYWWKLKEKFQGIQEPMERNEADLFDIGTFFHVAHNTEYLRYFISNILQFQFHEALCDESGYKGAYHKCSIHKSKKAGAKLRKMLELGKELPWPEALKVLTGSKEMSSKPLLDYFQPLEKWLDEHRNKNKYKLGWD